MHIKHIRHGSEAYRKSVNLREEILRKPLGMRFTPEFLQSDSEDYHIGIFDTRNRLFGILLLKPINNTTLKMRQVAVRESRHGKGIGRKLVEYSEIFAKKNGYSKIVLHARKNVIPFYEKLAYNVCSKEFTEVGIPHKKMEKDL